jgi:hypothetical protein
MNERVSHALNPTPERLLDGVAQAPMSSLRIERHRQLGNVDADHVVVDDSIRGPNATAATIGVRRGVTRPQLRRSTAIVEWSHKVGVEHLPSIFGGGPVEHIDPSARDAGVNPKLAAVR